MPQPAPIRKDRLFTLPDGRRIAYEIRGNPTAKNLVFWNHGIISSRYEVMSTNEGLLAEMDMVLVGIDRPCYGGSDPHPTRTFKSYAEDLAALADYLKAAQFFMVGVSGGGPYAYAAAHYLPDRVRGVMTISTLAPSGTMKGEEEGRYFAEMDPVGVAITRLFRRHRFLASLVHAVARSSLGGRALFYAFLQPLAKNCLSLMAENDRKCIEEEHREYTDLIVPESLRQGTASMFFEDIYLFEQPWDFDIRNIRPEVQRSIHIWHGTGDKQVPWVAAEVLHRLMPAAHLHIVKGGGHFAYYVGDKKKQREALKALLKSGAPLENSANS
ncbi:g4872 [Coccomyxa elongata]